MSVYSGSQNVRSENITGGFSEASKHDKSDNVIKEWFSGLKGDIDVQMSNMPSKELLEAIPSNALYWASESAKEIGDFETRGALLEEAQKRKDEWGKLAEITLKIDELRRMVEEVKVKQ